MKKMSEIKTIRIKCQHTIKNIVHAAISCKYEILERSGDVGAGTTYKLIGS